MAACFVCVSVCQTFSTCFLCRSYLFNAKMDQVHMWCAYALYQGECNVGGYVGVKGHLGGPVG